jgi:hypothetical protein
MIIFHFIFKLLKIPILKVDLNRIFLNVVIGTRCLIIENGLNIDEVLILKIFQVSGPLDIYVLSNYA